MIRFEHVRMEYENYTPIKDLSGEIKDDLTVSIIGPSGTGKSTLLKLINGLETPTSGSIYYNDIKINSPTCDKKALHKDIGMLFQDYSLFNHMTVMENLVVPQVDLLKISKKEATEIAMKGIKALNLEGTENMKPHLLSGGQRQRISMMRRLLLNPKVYLQDEPTSALDPINIQIISEGLKNRVLGNRTVIFVTHDMKYAEMVSDVVLYLDEGGIYEFGTPEEIFHNPKKPKTKEFIAREKTFEIIVHPNDLDLHRINNLIESHVVKNSLSTTERKNMISIFEELVAQTLFANDPNCVVKFLVYVDKVNQKLTYDIAYTGKKFNPFDTDTISMKLTKANVDLIEYNHNENQEFPNQLFLTIKDNLKY